MLQYDYRARSINTRDLRLPSSLMHPLQLFDESDNIFRACVRDDLMLTSSLHDHLDLFLAKVRQLLDERSVNKASSRIGPILRLESSMICLSEVSDVWNDATHVSLNLGKQLRLVGR